MWISIAAIGKAIVLVKTNAVHSMSFCEFHRSIKCIKFPLRDLFCLSCFVCQSFGTETTIWVTPVTPPHASPTSMSEWLPLLSRNNMAAFLDQLNSYLWSEKWWLGDDAKWEDFIPKDPNTYYPRVRDMNWSIPVGMALLLVRYAYER